MPVEYNKGMIEMVPAVALAFNAIENAIVIYQRHTDGGTPRTLVYGHELLSVQVEAIKYARAMDIHLVGVPLSLPSEMWMLVGPEAVVWSCP